MYKSLTLILSMWTICVAQAEEYIPAMSSNVVDEANALSVSEREAIIKQIEVLHRTGKVWLSVLTMQEIPGGNIEAYAVKVFESWRLGEKDRDQGVLIVLGVNDRQIRLEVGYGLEGDLTDSAAIRIIDDDMVPYFKEGAWGSGIQSGIAGIAKRLNIEFGSIAPPQNIKKPWLTTYFGPNTSGRKVFLLMLCTVLIVTLTLELSQIRDGTWTLAGTAKSVLGMLGAFGFLGCFLGMGFYAGFESNENMFFIISGIFYLLFFGTPFVLAILKIISPSLYKKFEESLKKNNGGRDGSIGSSSGSSESSNSSSISSSSGSSSSYSSSSSGGGSSGGGGASQRF